MWKLQSVNKETYNCFQFLSATISKFYDRDYRLMMLELWGFSYDDTTDETIGNKIKLCWNYKSERRKSLLNYHGLSFEIIDVKNIDFDHFIRDNLTKRPVAVYIDSYVCSWIPFFQKLHRPHALFILEEKSERYLFLDQYTNENEVNEIDAAFIKSNSTYVIIFKPESSDKVNTINNFILEILKEWEEYGFFQCEAFINDMKNNLNISREIVDDPIASQLIMYMKNLSEDRKNFIEAISFIEGYFQSDLNDIKDILNDISMRYEKLRAYIIKCAFSHKNHKPDVISTELNYIYSSEHQIYNILSSLVKRNEERAYD